MSNDPWNKLRDRIPEPQPPAGHERRFRRKLLELNQKPKRSLYWLWYASAACILAVVITVAVTEIHESNERAERISLQDLPPRVAATETFLIEQLTDKSASVDLSNPQIAHHVKRLRILEKEHSRLDSLLQSPAANERVVKAMINNYQLRLEVLEHILTELQIQKRAKRSENRPQT